MSSFAVQCLDHSFDLTLALPGSKSISNRVLMMAALSDAPSVLNNLLECDDVETCRQALLSMRSDQGIDCRDSGIVTRFLLPLCAALGGTYYFDGSARMRERPLTALIKVLQQQGVEFEFQGRGKSLPLVMRSQGLSGGELYVECEDSSQFLSGLLMAAPLCATGMTLRASVMIARQPYVMMTLKLMAQFGIQFEMLDDFCVRVLPGAYQATSMTVESDASTASYFFAAAALTQSRIFIPRLGFDSLQGDIRFLEVLEMMGCVVLEKDGGIQVQGPKRLRAVGALDMREFADTFMTLAVMAPFLPEATSIFGLQHARLQESDRVAAMAEGLARAGIFTDTSSDSITIFPGVPQPARIDSHHDHRIAMSFAIMGLKIPGMVIDDADCVSKTCPEFFSLLTKLGAAHGE